MIDPRATGPMKVIVDQNDPIYYERRAAEFIAEGQECFSHVDLSLYLDPITDDQMGAKNATYIARYHECMKQAITLLALARLARGPVQEKEG